MKLLMASGGKLLVQENRRLAEWTPGDLPLAAHGIHELLFHRTDGVVEPAYVAMAFVARLDGSVVWCEATRTFYPPALTAAGVPTHRLHVVAPKRQKDVTWVAAECLRCSGVRAVVASVPSRLSRVEVRRLQLAAEHGRTLGVLLRPAGPGDDVYAALSRWLVSPMPGEPTTQRWHVELIHGQGRHAYPSFVVERRYGAALPVVVPSVDTPATVVVCPTHTLADRAAPAPRSLAVG